MMLRALGARVAGGDFLALVLPLGLLLNLLLEISLVLVRAGRHQHMHHPLPQVVLRGRRFLSRGKFLRTTDQELTLSAQSL